MINACKEGGRIRDEYKETIEKVILSRMLHETEYNLELLNRIKDNLVPDDWYAIASWTHDRYGSISKEYVQKLVYDYQVKRWNGKKGRKPFALGEVGSDSYVENKKMKSTEDVDLRSKSELVIFEKLREYKIVFEYEQTLIINNIAYHPDFFITKPNGEFVIWEHLGKTNDKGYLKSQIPKFKDYIEHGFVPWDNLIVTFDGKDGEFNANEVEFQILNKILR